MEVNIDGSLSYPEPQFDITQAEKHSLPKPLSTEEEQLMQVFYEHKIQEVCGAFGFPHKIQVYDFVPKKSSTTLRRQYHHFLLKMSSN